MEQRDNSREKLTLTCCFLSFFIQAIVINFTPLLFTTFIKDFSVSLDKITLITTANFAVQLATDALSAKYVDKLGYKKSMIFAHMCCFFGIIGLAFLPFRFKSAYLGIFLSTIIYAVGGGLIEVLTNPIVDSVADENKAGTMSLLHSFFCWGHMFTVLLSAAFFAAFGMKNWRILAVLWAAVPLINGILFIFAPIKAESQHAKKTSVKNLIKNKSFLIMLLLMICAGASEQGMSQWASAYAQSGLGISKAAADLAGPCAFALMMGASRTAYAKFSRKVNMIKVMSASAILCALCYIAAAASPISLPKFLSMALCGLSVGVMWPGTISLAAEDLSDSGTKMFALLALAGDIGCTLGPTSVGFVSSIAGGELKNGMWAGLVFPVILLVCLVIYKGMKREKR